MITDNECIRPAAVTDEAAIRDFLRLFSRAGDRKLISPPLSELRKLEILPLVFRLVPRHALSLSPVRGRFRPYIIEHLAAMGIGDPPDNLVMTLKHICEQIVLSNRDLAEDVGLQAKRKYGVADLRAPGPSGTNRKST